jgi:L-amino acid N-acyltransferase YncA
MRLTIAPITVKAALKRVKEWHRHLPDLQGGLFAATVLADGECVGVAVAGNPAKAWQGTGRIVIARVATNEERNACSKLYGAMCRAAQALGYREAWTYTLPEEPGTSLRAAGFEDMGLTAGGEHDRPSRRRKPAVRPEPKRRWRRILINTEPMQGAA